MIVVTARVETTQEDRNELLTVAQAMCQASRSEPGCIGYRFYEDTEEPNHFVVLEEWADDVALQTHFAQAHTAEFMTKMPGLLSGAADASFHTVASTRRLGRGGLVDVD